MKHFFLSTNWPMLFICIYLLIFIFIIYRGKKNFSSLVKTIKENQSNPRAILACVERYIKHNPLSINNSTLRVSTIPILIFLGEKEKLQKCIRKIRVVDISKTATDSFLIALFLLKECHYDKEYISLKKKSVHYKPFEGAMGLLIQETIDIEHLPEELLSSGSKAQKGIAAYYQGVFYWQQEDFETANKQFELVKQNLPEINPLLKQKGYAE